MSDSVDFNPLQVYPASTTPTDGDGQKLIEGGKRYPIEYLVERWKAGETKPLNDLLKAFKKIEELDVDDEWSFAHIAGFHGRPFGVRKNSDENSWRGFCPHRNVLFPVWHRAYINYLEKALQKQVTDVMLAYWDQFGDETKKRGVPAIFLAHKVLIDGTEEDNPLRQFTFKWNTLDDYSLEENGELPDNAAKFESKDYTTQRFPLLHTYIGEDHTQNDKYAKQHNEKYFIPGKDAAKNGRESAVDVLCRNVREELYGLEDSETVTGDIGGAQSGKEYGMAFEKYCQALQAKNYTSFSNSTSMTKERINHDGEDLYSLEAPHNDIHAAVGKKGVNFPDDIKGEEQPRRVGEMGINERAAFDPIFYFHHCFVDLIFWKWQNRYGATEALTVDETDPGAKPQTDAATPYQTADTALTMTTPLHPFKRPKKGSDEPSPAEKCVSDPTSLEYLTGEDMTDLRKLHIEYVTSREFDSVYTGLPPVGTPSTGMATASTVSPEFGVVKSAVKTEGIFVEEPPSEPPRVAYETASEQTYTFSPSVHEPAPQVAEESHHVMLGEPPKERPQVAAKLDASKAKPPRKKIIVRHFDRAAFSGTFTVKAFVTLGDSRYFVGYDTVFNREVPLTCKGCMNDRYMDFVFFLSKVDPRIVNDVNTQIEIEIEGSRMPNFPLDYKPEFA